MALALVWPWTCLALALAWPWAVLKVLGLCLGLEVSGLGLGLVTCGLINITGITSFQYKISTQFLVGISGLAKSNMLSKISREPRELPWQPKLGKKDKNAPISVLGKKSRTFSHE